VNDALARLARALEARDVNQVAAVYAGITAQERAAWTDFFATNSSVRVRVSDIAVVPETADIAQPTFTMTIDFADDSGPREPWVQRNRATFVRGPNGWRIEAIREAR
jgi:ketosteroid isomerase-like protein